MAVQRESRNRPLGLASRTRKNLQFIITAAEAGQDVHPVTELTTSLLALIVIPREKRLGNHVLKTRLELLPPKWPKWRVHFGNVKRLDELLERLRNAISHGNVEFSSESRTLAQVEVTFSDLGQSGKDAKWSATISADALLAFSLAYIELLESTVPALNEVPPNSR